MNLVKCDNEHYYDSDAYDKCPYCDEIAINFKNALTALDDKKFDIAKTELLFVVSNAKRKEDDEHIIVSSGNEIVHALLEKYFSPRPITEADYNYSMAYCLLGEIEVENGNMLKAREYLNLSLKWNPYNAEAIFENAETYKMLGDIEEFYRLTVNNYDKLLFPKDIARFYRNLGFYYIEKEHYNLALCLFLHSLTFEESTMAFNEIVYIKEKAGIDAIPLPEVTNQMLEANNIPLGVCDENISVLKDLGLLKEKPMYCAQCGAELSKDSAFCFKCGKNLEPDPDATVGWCDCCNFSPTMHDNYCRNCGVNLKTIYSKSKSFTDEEEIKTALVTLERLMLLNLEDDKNEYVLSHLLELIYKVPLYIPMEVDMEAMLGDIDPLTLKKGDIIQPQQDVRMKILTVNINDTEVIPLFTSSDKANKNQSVSTTRMYPSDYLPIITKMDKNMVINPFDNERFTVPDKYLKTMLANINFEKAKKAETFKCSNCKAELPNNAKFCAKCGIEIHKTEVFDVPKDDGINNENLEGLVIDGKYEFLKKFGENYGNGTSFYLAMDKRINKQYAVEVFNKKTDDQNHYRLNGFLSKYQMLKKLDHPAITKIFDTFENDDYAFIVMDYVDGETLKNIFTNYGPQSEKLVANWAVQICDVLSYLWNQTNRIIHRDIKPHNIILQPNGNIKLMDFSIAREYIYGLKHDEQFYGTKGFAAPEQFGAAQTDNRTDIYALGVTMHYLMTGKDPVKPPYEVLPVRQYNQNLSEGIEYIINKCTQLNPKDRYQSAQELKMDLLNVNKLPPRKNLFNKIFK